jgi:hypothetical protein
VLLGATPASATLTGYTFESLNGCCTISGSAAKVTDAAIGPAINDLGDVVVQTLGSHTGYVLKDGVWYPFTYKAATPSSNTYAIPFDINDADVVVGTTTDGGPGGIGGVGGSEEAAAWKPVGPSGSPAPIVLGQADGGDSNCTGSASFTRRCSAFATNITTPAALPATASSTSGRRRRTSSRSRGGTQARSPAASIPAI